MFGISDREYEELQRENERYIREQMKIDNANRMRQAKMDYMDCNETSDGGSVGGSDTSDDEVEEEEVYPQLYKHKSRIRPPLCSTSQRIKMVGVRGGNLPMESISDVKFPKKVKDDPPLANTPKESSVKSTKIEKVSMQTPSVKEMSTQIATESDEDTKEKHNDLEYEEKRYYGKSNCFVILISTDMTMVKVRNILAKHCNDPNFVKTERFKGDIEKYKPAKKGVIEYVKGPKAKHMHAYFTTTKIMKPSRICEILVESGVMLSLEPDSKRVTAYDYK